MAYEDLGKVEYLPFAESVELIKNRQLDATLQSAGLGVASIKDLAISLPTNVVAVPAEIAESMGAPFIAATIPAGTYEGQTEDVATVAITNLLVTHDGRVGRGGLPDDQAALRKPRRDGRCTCCRPRHFRRERAAGPPHPAAPGRGALLQGNGPDVRSPAAL
jgi:hypothetical protein